MYRPVLTAPLLHCRPWLFYKRNILLKLGNFKENSIGKRRFGTRKWREESHVNIAWERNEFQASFLVVHFKPNEFGLKCTARKLAWNFHTRCHLFNPFTLLKGLLFRNQTSFSSWTWSEFSGQKHQLFTYGRRILFCVHIFDESL